MSKAFTRESDSDGELGVELPPLAPGTRNYMTREGARALQAEIEGLKDERRGLALDTLDGQNRAQTIDRRLDFLIPRRDALEIIDPAQQPPEEVRFGAWVTVVDAGAKEETWRIVGFDEADANRGWISWMSPLANALLGLRVGQTFRWAARSATIRQITYERRFDKRGPAAG